MISKCMDSAYFVVTTPPLQFSTDCFKTLQINSAWNEDMHVV